MIHARPLKCCPPHPLLKGGGRWTGSTTCAHGACLSQVPRQHAPTCVEKSVWSSFPSRALGDLCPRSGLQSLETTDARAGVWSGVWSTQALSSGGESSSKACKGKRSEREADRSVSMQVRSTPRSQSGYVRYSAITGHHSASWSSMRAPSFAHACLLQLAIQRRSHRQLPQYRPNPPLADDLRAAACTIPTSRGLHMGQQKRKKAALLQRQRRRTQHG